MISSSNALVVVSSTYASPQFSHTVQVFLPELPGVDRLTVQFYGRAMTVKDSHCARADWHPLETILPLEECGPFMYMGWLEVDGQRLHHYKHEITRRYLFVTDELKTYQYVGGDDYVLQARKRAIQHLFCGTARIKTQPSRSGVAPIRRTP